MLPKIVSVESSTTEESHSEKAIKLETQSIKEEVNTADEEKLEFDDSITISESLKQEPSPEVVMMDDSRDGSPAAVGDDPTSYLDDSSNLEMTESFSNEDSILVGEESILQDDEDVMEVDEIVLDEAEDVVEDGEVTDVAEWKPDPSVPKGWCIREFYTRAGQKLEHIRSPGGNFFPGRRAAMEWMREQGASPEDLVIMQSKLKIKWLEDQPNVPPGWKTRKSIIKSINGVTEMEWFMSPGVPTGRIFRGKKAVLKAIQNEPGAFTEEEIKKFRSVPVPIKKFSADYAWREDDPTVPPGWRSAIVKMNSFGKMVESTRYLAPDGRFCTSRIEAIKYLLKDEHAHAEELYKMRSGLLVDGWVTSPQLPQYWYMKPDRCRGKRKEAHYNYLSADMSYLRSTKAAVAHMSEDPQYTQNDIDKLIKKSQLEGNKLRPDKYDWIEGDERVPEGWKIRIVHCSNGLDREFFLAPDGGSYSGRKQALDYLKKNGASAEDIRRMESGCKIVWNDQDPTLPTGWKTRCSEINTRTGKVPMQWFLNPEGKMFRGRKSALEEICNSGEYTREDIRRFKFVIPENKKTNYTWEHNDPSVPTGWLTTLIQMNSFGKLVRSKRFMAPDGRFCTSRDEAIKYMVKEGIYEQEEIAIMEEGFDYDSRQAEYIKSEDLETEESLMEATNGSEGTKRKFQESPTSHEITKRIKTEEGLEIKEEVVSDQEMEEEEGGSSDQFKVEMQEEDDDQDEDFVPKLRITKLKSKRNRKKTPSRKKKEEDDDRDYKPYQTKSGRKVNRVSTSESQSNSRVKEEGWVEDDPSVPAGWKTREYVNKGGQNVKHIMSPTGVFFAGRKAALEHMEASPDGNYTPEDMELMQSGLRLVWGEDDPTMPEGWKTRITDIRTKAGLTQMQWFRSPDGQLFRGRKSALKFLESSDSYSNDDIKAFKSRPASEKKFSKDYDWTEEDPNIPEGWKSTVIQMNSFGKMVPSSRFLAPDGRYCSNRIDALRYMVKEGIYTHHDFEIMKGGLLTDGWRMDENLPAGWYMKPRKDKANEATASYHYLTENYRQFDSTKAAVKYIHANPEEFPPDTVAKLEVMVNATAKALCPDKYDWLENRDTLPEGWKYRTVVCSNGLERHFFLAPDGSSYSGRKQAVDYMKKNDFKPDDIKKMESGFKVKWVENDPNVPAGWKTRSTDMKTKAGVIAMQWFLSPEGKMFRGKKSAIDYITNSGRYTKEDIRKLRCSGETPTKTQYDWNETDTTVPPGWKSTMITVNSFGKIVESKRYLSPDGRFCSSRIDALKYMHRENIFRVEDVAAMKAGLLMEGWEVENMLPAGWLIKPDRHKEEEATFNYLTPDFQFLRSTRSAQAYIQTSEQYSQDDVTRLLTMVADERKKIRLDRFGTAVAAAAASSRSISPRVADNSPTLPNGWKMKSVEGGASRFIAPDKTSFTSRAQALAFMVANKHQTTDIEMMRQELKQEGWEESSLLPDGWKLQKLECDTDLIFISREGEIFDSLDAAVEEVEGNYIYSDTDRINIKSLYDNQSKSIKLNTIKYEWTDDDDTVPSGWKTRTVEGKLKRKFYLSPDGSVFACRRSCLQHLIKQRASESTVEEMRAKLCHEGWETVDFLPDRWLIRKSEGSTNGIYDVDFWILNSEGVVFRSTKTATEFMAVSDQYTQKDIDKVVNKLESERKRARKLKYEWLDGDESVPNGWKVRHVEGKTKKTFFLSTDDTQFACRRSALQHMLKENFPAEAIAEMREKLSHEGWENDTVHLPLNWKVRKSEGCTNGQFDVNYYYLSDDGVMFHSTKAVISYMRKGDNRYTEEDVSKIKLRLEIETRKNRPNKYKWLEDDGLPAGWKYRTIVKAGIRTDYVITEKNYQFQSRRAAIEWVIKENFDPQVIYRMWNTLDAEGWVTEDRLPKGWRVRSKERLKDSWQFYFLSPQMEVFKSNKSVLDHILALPDTYSEDDYQKVKEWIEEEQRIRREANYTWHAESNLPPGWKTRSVVTNSNNVREFFLTPDGDQIAGRKKAIEMMRDMGASAAIINAQTRKMKQVSTRNQNKVPEDFVKQAEPAEEKTAADQYCSDGGGEEGGEAALEEAQMFENEDGSQHFDLSGMEPEFEPVEITSLDYGDEEKDEEEEEDDDEDDDEENGFNDVEEITDDSIQYSNDSETVRPENIKIEPDIGTIMD